MSIDISKNQTSKDPRIQILPSGKVQISQKDAVDLFKEFTANWWRTQIVSVGLGGNRQALTAKFEVYKEYISLSPKERNQGNFFIIAKKKGYRIEAIQDLWTDFQEIYQAEFISYLKGQAFGVEEKKDNEFLQF